MNPKIIRAIGAFMAIVGLCLVGAMLGISMSTVHIVGTMNCTLQPDMCRSLVNPMQLASVVCGGGGAVAALSGMYAYTQA